MTAEAGPRRTRDPEAKRAALLESARSLFARHGYGGVNIRAIAEDAGVNQSLIFRYFGSKDGLFIAATQWDTVIASMFADGPWIGLDRLISTLFPESTAAPASNPLLAIARSTDEEGEIADLWRAALNAAIAELVPLFDRPDAELLAGSLMAWLIGLSVVQHGLDVPSVARADASSIRMIVGLYLTGAATDAAERG